MDAVQELESVQAVKPFLGQQWASLAQASRFPQFSWSMAGLLDVILILF